MKRIIQKNNINIRIRKIIDITWQQDDYIYLAKLADNSFIIFKEDSNKLVPVQLTNGTFLFGEAIQVWEELIKMECLRNNIPENEAIRIAAWRVGTVVGKYFA